LDNAFSAVREEMLFRTVSAIWECSFRLPISACTPYLGWAWVEAPVVEEKVVLDNHSIGQAQTFFQC
jgi:hypothetical protein